MAIPNFVRCMGAAGAASVSVLVAALSSVGGQPTSDSPLAPPPNGVRKVEPGGGWHALVGATIHVSPTTTIPRATVVLRDGKIVAIDEAPAPAGAQVHDAAGLHIYAGFIEPYLEVEVPRPDMSSPGAHWNPRITPQRSALDKGSRGIDERTGQSLRELGFTAAAISPKGGIFRGRSAVVSLARPSGDPSMVGPRVYRDAAYQAVSFETSFVEGLTDPRTEPTPDDVRWSNYPNSQMGAIALIRQTLSDADWQGAQRMQGGLTQPSNALDWLIPPQTASAADGDDRSAKPDRTVPQGWGGLLLFDTTDELEALRATKIGREFSRSVAVLGSGREYRRLDALVQDGVPLVLPLNFPRPPQVETIGEANATELDELIAWEQAPTNAARVDEALRAAGVARQGDVSLTTSKGQSARGGRGGRRGGATGAGGAAGGGGQIPDGRDNFDDRLSTAIKHGLAPDRALAMLTVNPAKLLGVENLLGTVEPGKAANLVVSDGPLFMDKPDAPKRGEPGYVRPARIVEVWIDGTRNEVKARPEIDISGHYEVTFTPPLPPEIKVTFNFATDDPGDEPEFTITKTTIGAGEGEKPAARRGEGRGEGRRGSGGGGGGGGGHDGGAEIKVRGFDRFGPGLSRFSFTFDHEPFGEKGVFQNSGSIEKDKDGTVVLHGDFVRSSGARMDWTARRTGPAAPKKPSLAGAWPATFDQPGAAPAGGANPGAPVLIFDRGNVLSLQLAPGVRGREDGKPPKVENFSYDGRSIKYEFDQAQMGMPGVEGVAQIEATIDWTAHPPRMTGTITPAGDKQAWTATRRDRNPFAGEWRVTQADDQALPEAGPKSLTIKISGARDNPAVKLVFSRDGQRPLEIDGDGEDLRIGKLFFSHDLTKLGMEGKSSDEITVNWGKDGPEGDVLVGLGRMTDGSVHPYEARRTKASLEGDRKESAAIAAIPKKLGLPVGGYAVDGAPKPERVFITGATIWTCKDGTSDTVIENGAVVISDGVIQYVGSEAGSPRLAGEFITIDAKGKFIAPGIIDCHSHTGISRGVNESGQAVTAEVRIGDVTNPDDVSWYRQLAGGVTCVNNLHGSANAIGGQNQVNKIRWGCLRPDDMHFEGAIPGIKFALGENPKQSNWGDRNTTRYPQTRMGVETLIRDRFTAAKEYRESLKTPGFRRDLELEALAEVLDGKRLIHCHSYRQDEILMLCRVARDFGFKIGTFQHILEGYKVADELAKWSGGGSSFSDWWAYKYEVVDAIPADGPIMAEQGVVVSYNSDSDEMARRLNVEAGKAAKYSGRNGGKVIPPHEAFKFVSLNPAKQLRIDKQTGSLEAGKQADLAIWSGPPTSATSRCEVTWVDGRRLFSLAQDAAHRTQIAAERARLVQKVLSQGSGGRGPGRGRGESDDDEGSGPVASDTAEDDDGASGWLGDLQVEISNGRSVGRRLMLLEAMQTAADRRRDLYMNMLLRGLDPRWMRAGDCGCGQTGGEQ